jgi:probable addiction module antidote protein
MTKRQPWKDHDEFVVEQLRGDPAFAAGYLNDVLADGDQAEFLGLLRKVANAGGGIPKIAEAAGLNKTSLYRTLSDKGNPELRSFLAILAAAGLRMQIEPIAKPKKRGTVPRAAARR